MNLPASTRFLLIGALFLAFCSFLESDCDDGRKIRLMFYNVENLFDPDNDPATDDEEFLPSGTRGWTRSRYLNKLNAVYKAVVSAGDGNLPAICGFSEVENRKVLEDLLTLTPLNRNNIYSIVHEESTDIRGIDVCLIYRKDLLSLENYRYYFPEDLLRSGFRSRSVLYTKWIWCGKTFHLFLNHWPSRRGGVVATEKARMSFARMVKHKADSIKRADGDCDAIIIAGDLNCDPGAPEEKIFSGQADGPYLNMIVPLLTKGRGTYKYNGLWEAPDQVIISKSMISGCEGLKTGLNDIRIIDKPELLVKDKKYPGYKPFSTYSGFSYRGGFSDHLPVVIDLHCSR